MKAVRFQMGGTSNNTKFLVTGFAAILAGMAGLIALFVFHMSTIAAGDQLNASLTEKNLAAFKMRDAAEKRLLTLIHVTALDDFFERDALRLQMTQLGGAFVRARAQINVESLNESERLALNDILAAVRASQPIIEDTMRMAVEGQWNPEIQAKVIESTEHFSKVHDALNKFVAEVEAETHIRKSELDAIRASEMKVIPGLGGVLFFISLVVGSFVIRREMTQTKILEKRVQERTNSLAERETHFRTIIETAADSIISADDKGSIESFNPASEQIFGYAASEVIGRSLNLLMPMSDAEHHDRHMNNYLDDGKPKIIGIGRELLGLRKNGETVPIWLAVNRMEVGGKIKFVGIISDISAQKKAEGEILQLAEVNEIVASILRLSLSPVDPTKTLQDALDLILDRPNQDHMGKGAIFLNDAAQSRLEMCAQIRMPGGVTDRCQFVKYGECLCGSVAVNMAELEKTAIDPKRYIELESLEDDEILCVPINYGSENLGVLTLYYPAGHAPTEHERRLTRSVADALAGVIHRDHYQQELVLAKENAELSNRTKTEFLANMSHELRTPLNAIIGYAEMMENEILGPVGTEKYMEYLGHISGSGYHLYDLINDLLDVSRIETDAFPLDEESFSVAELLDACIGTVKHRAELAGNTVKVADGDALPLLQGDKRRFKQVLINLLHNAIKFTPKGGEITVLTKGHENGDYMIMVRDTGIGIAQEDIETVFTMFGQVDGSLARKYDGAGLGLPLSRKLMEKHGGKLELISELTQGTTAIITVPSARVFWNQYSPLPIE